MFGLYVVQGRSILSITSEDEDIYIDTKFNDQEYSVIVKC